MNTNINKIKIRKSWGSIKPFQRPHSSKKGKRGYDRKESRRIENLAYSMAI